jgi:HemY protein
VTPNGRLDGFQWRVPLAEIGVGRAVIEVTEPEAAEPAAADETGGPKPEPAAPATAPIKIEPPIEVGAAHVDSGAKSGDGPRPRPPEPRRKSPEPPAKPRAAEPVIPLVHAPDDPGPEAGPDGEPVPEASPPRDAWQRIRQLFR